MLPHLRRTLPCALILTMVANFVAAEDADTPDGIVQASVHRGEMTMPVGIDRNGLDEREGLVFEPYQMLNDFLTRSDLVYLMRHGPTDWSFRDARGVEPTDCENQRVMTDLGRRQMEALGAIITFYNLRPGEIVVSEWCRNQQTLEALRSGMARIDEDYAATVPVETDPSLNLLLSLGGAENVTDLRERILSWDGGDGTGPLLLITHFTNIAELTEFNVYEGEILVLDPTLEGRVLGYLRLRSSEPDVGHFDTSDVER